MGELKIKEFRKKSRLTQKEFAEILGVDRRTVSNWEAGGKIPPERRKKILSAINGGWQNNLSGNNIGGDNYTHHNYQSDGESIGRAFDEIAAQRMLVEKSQELLVKAQEHIDRLLSILEKQSNGTN